MPYADKAKQKEYQRLYYEKYIRRSPAGSLQGDNHVIKQHSKPLKIDLSNYKGYIDVSTDSDNTEVSDDEEDSTDEDEDIYEETFEEDEIPRWIRHMTDEDIIQKAEELASRMDEKLVDKILDYYTVIFGTTKSRIKREYILKKLHDCQLVN